jgi:hypothetical protein
MFRQSLFTQNNDTDLPYAASSITERFMYQSKAGQSVSYQRTLNVTASMERLQHFSVQTKLPKSLDDSIRAYLAAMDLQND